MADRPRSPDPDEEGRALWKRVTETVRPLHRKRAAKPVATIADEEIAPRPVKRVRGRVPPPKVPDATPISRQKPVPDGLDGGWDRRIRRGGVEPDWTVDLHGHTLLSAHRLLDETLARAIADGVRVVLIITGKPPRDHDRHHDGRPRRGLIRAEIGSWIAASRHHARIAAVRNAHPRHGGSGALYIILRRPRGE